MRTRRHEVLDSLWARTTARDTVGNTNQKKSEKRSEPMNKRRSQQLPNHPQLNVERVSATALTRSPTSTHTHTHAPDLLMKLQSWERPRRRAPLCLLVSCIFLIRQRNSEIEKTMMKSSTEAGRSNWSWGRGRGRGGGSDEDGGRGKREGGGQLTRAPDAHAFSAAVLSLFLSGNLLFSVTEFLSSCCFASTRLQ